MASFYKMYQRYKSSSSSTWLTEEVIVPCFEIPGTTSVLAAGTTHWGYSGRTPSITAVGTLINSWFLIKDAFYSADMGQNKFYFVFKGQNTRYDIVVSYGNATWFNYLMTVSELEEAGLANYITRVDIELGSDESFSNILFRGTLYYGGRSTNITLFDYPVFGFNAENNPSGALYYPVILHYSDDKYYAANLRVIYNYINLYNCSLIINTYNSTFDTIIRGLEPFNPDERPDPYISGGTTGDDDTEPEGGDGTFENEEATIDPPALPGLSAITSGFLAVYNPTFSQLQSLGDYLWSDLFSLDTFKKLFSDPMQAILGLSIVPVQPGTASGTVVIGNVNTGITMPRCTSQFVTVDCGTVTLPEYWGGYLDYSPYTKVEIYLPYIGVRPLDTDEVMGKTLHVVYHVDILSGSCVCFIQCDNTIRYHYVGQCGASIPITANDWTRVVNGAVSIATALGVGVATLGAGAAAAGGVTAASMAGTGALVGGIASQVLASKPRVEHSGSLAGMGGLLGVQVPYIMVVRPRQAVPEGQNAFTGYPSFIRRTLSTVTGYTQVTGVHLVNLTCTDEEKKEIQAQLEAGVIL